MTLREQIRAKFEEHEFDSDKVLEWIMSHKQHPIEKKKEAFWILTSFPEYGEPTIIKKLKEKNGR